MKNFNIMRVHKNPIYRGDCLKRGTWTVFRYKGGLAKKWEGGVLEGEGLIPPMHTM